jgi:Ca2+-binding EF-hand superfamily protein
VKLPQPVRRYGLRAAAGGLAAVGLTTFAALPVAAAPDFASIFKSMDADGDGVLTAQEFARTVGKDGDQKSVERQVTTRTITIDRDDAPAAAPAKGTTEIKQDAFAFWLPDDDSSVSTQQVNSVQHREVRIVTDSHDADAIATPPSLEDIRADEFKAFDTDKDGKVSLAEFQARHRAMLTRGFEILDANKDKYLSAMEYAQMSNPPLPHLGGDPPIPAVPVPPGDKPMMTPEKLQASFTRLDTNKDSRLSLQEYLPPA